MINRLSLRRFAPLVLLFVTALALPAADDPSPDRPEPPPVLRKKKKDPPPAEGKAPDKKPEPPRKDAGPKDKDEGGDPALAQEPDQDPREIAARVSKNMRQSEER